MDLRCVAAIAISAAAPAAGCAAPPSLLGTHTATVLINGENTGAVHPVQCRQDGWRWHIESPGTAGFSAMIQTGTSPAADTVQIRDLGGFTGSFWTGTVGDGSARVSGDKFTISGTAHGYFTDHPTTRTDATFEITTAC